MAYVQPFPESFSMQRMLVQDALGRQWATHDVLGITQDSLGRLWFATRAGVGCQTSTGWQFYTGEDGLPYNEFTQISAGLRGEVWFGTQGAWSFRNGQWGIVKGSDGFQMTSSSQCKSTIMAMFGSPQTGIGVIRQQTMTLSEKRPTMSTRSKLTSNEPPLATFPVTLPEAGSRTSNITTVTTMVYGPACMERESALPLRLLGISAARGAHQAFRALAFLQEVTQGGSTLPPKGMSLINIRSTTLPDPNDGP